MHSRFLPEDFSPARSVTVLAGKGRYPELTIERLRAAAVPVKLVAFEEETAPELAATFAAADTAWIKVGQLGHLLDALRRFKTGYTIMAGQITPRRLFNGLVPDVKAVLILASLKEKNAETIFGALAAEIAKIGVTPLDARVLLDDQLATAGCMTGWRSGIAPRTLAYGVRIAKEIARLDIGQGVVVSGGTTIAVEAFEGTDKMLRRCAQIGAREPLFIKTVKPGQDYRFDVPCFGLHTLESMAQGGVRHAALEVGKVLILEKEKVLTQARKLGIVLHGYEADGTDGTDGGDAN
ncbi:MAG: UDP-2,3-diacylglucosamine diphosphatase LpxI [Puniceicoccales bacterium]|nr:UDP-2,3-diacylglucosamine diphosphatase LpxI [Puniceicoccales bacterium]